MKIAEFISKFEFYDAEESGIKSYTIRDNTFRLERKLDHATHIRIRRGYTSKSFTRKITHVCCWKDNVIIAWNPNENIKCHLCEFIQMQVKK